MKKTIITLSIIFSFAYSSLMAEAQEVPKLEAEKTTFMKKNWQPWAVATISVLIAATGIYVVANHKGKKHDDHVIIDQ